MVKTPTISAEVVGFLCSTIYAVPLYDKDEMSDLSTKIKNLYLYISEMVIFSED